jgi:HEPN domain-containing protein
MKKKPLHRQWLDRARSNLERAKLDKLSRHIVYEDMCYDCQQAVEKALKALMVFKNIDFQWTHDISILIKTLEDNRIEVPENINESASLTVYAVKTRYPGEEEPVNKREFQQALDLAETVYRWVTDQIDNGDNLA